MSGAPVSRPPRSARIMSSDGGPTSTRCSMCECTASTRRIGNSRALLRTRQALRSHRRSPWMRRARRRWGPGEGAPGEEGRLVAAPARSGGGCARPVSGGTHGSESPGKWGKEASARVTSSGSGPCRRQGSPRARSGRWQASGPSHRASPSRSSVRARAVPGRGVPRRAHGSAQRRIRVGGPRDQARHAEHA